MNSEHIPNGQVSDDPIAQAIIEHWGERCPDYSEGCPCCDVWSQYDALTRRSSAGVKVETKIEAQPIHALPMPPYDFQGNAALTPSPTLEPTDAEVER
jgi:hypothetical protein